MKPPDQESEYPDQLPVRQEEVEDFGSGGASAGCVVFVILVGALLTVVGLVVGLIRWLG